MRVVSYVLGFQGILSKQLYITKCQNYNKTPNHISREARAGIYILSSFGSWLSLRQGPAWAATPAQIGHEASPDTSTPPDHHVGGSEPLPRRGLVAEPVTTPCISDLHEPCLSTFQKLVLELLNVDMNKKGVLECD